MYCEAKLPAGTSRNVSLTSSVWAFERPPPGCGVKTVTSAVPGDGMSLEEIAAVSLEVETKVVGRSWPLKRTTESYMNPLPLTVRVKSGSPAMTVPGDRLVVAGDGLGDCTIV